MDGVGLARLCRFGAACRKSVPPLSRVRAISSGVERLVYTENVGGSIPSSPTIPRGSGFSSGRLVVSGQV